MPGASVLVLGWRLGDQIFGTQVHSLAHIEQSPHLCRLPRPSPGVGGLAYYRRQLIPVLDLAYLLLGETGRASRAGPMYLVFQGDDGMYAGRVDSVLRMFLADTENLTTWPSPPDHPAAQFVCALLPMEEDTLWLVDIRRVVRYVHRRPAVSTPYVPRGA